ncbi:MAG: glycosyltransferase family 2 protein [Paludibacter sp.]|nr:glycosyltransferase family 2 protein [Paludibacter sp.]MDD4426770.1 glycosyltransferase family 2 protein [Paludibacter sp.]
MKTAIVILNWNGGHYLQKFLPFLLQHTALPDVEIYVADNGSTDKSVVLLGKNFKEVKILLFDRNYGFAEGYNRALAQIEADYFVILNSDVEVTSGWLKPMLDYLEQHADVAACQPKILSYDKRTYFEHAGAAGGFIDFLGYPFCRGRILAVTEEDRGQYDEVCDVFWATGACLLIRADIFKNAGGFDDDFFAHMEEIDLCWRLKSRGYRIVCVPESKVFHVGGGTLHVEHPHKTYLNFRNNLLLLYKNLSKQNLFPVLFVRFFMDYLAAFQLFVTGKPRNAKAVFKARKDYRKMLPSFKNKRRENLQKTIRSHIPEIARKSIILNYYLLGKKRFSG